jgi:hypothetical protein
MRRLSHAWRELEAEQRLAALTAGGLFVSMFLPWYSKTDTVVVREAAKATQTSLSAFEAFSFVEAAVLLVSAGVLTMLFARAEGHDFQLPGGDGTVVMLAGGWAALLIFYRLLDKPGLQGNQRITATVGVEWGIFIALLLALGLLYAGRRIRSEGRPQPPLLRGRGDRQPRSPRDPRDRGDPRDPGNPRDRGDPRGGARREREPAAEDPTVRAQGGVPPGAGERLAAPVAARARPPASASTSSAAAMPTAQAPAAPAPGTLPAARKPGSGRPRFPPAPAEQMSFDDPPPGSE